MAPASAGAKPATSGSTKIVVSFTEVSAAELPRIVASETGLFQKHGVDVQERMIPGVTGVDALVSGDVQVTLAGGAQALSAIAGGADLQIVGTPFPTYGFLFYAPASIKTPAVLKGKKIGVPSAGSTGEVAVRLALPRFGLDPLKDVTMVYLGSPQARVPALLGGSVDGSPITVPDNVKLDSSGFHSLFDISQLKLEAVTQVVQTQRSWLANHRDAMQGFIDGLVEANVRIKKDKPFALEMMRKHLKYDDERMYEMSYDYYFAEGAIPTLMHPKPSQFADSMTVLGEKNEKVRNLDLGKILDPSFVQAAADRGLAG
jgi:NitT/TauT family transport system substrate-binding protein